MRFVCIEPLNLLDLLNKFFCESEERYGFRAGAKSCRGAVVAVFADALDERNLTEEVDAVFFCQNETLPKETKIPKVGIPAIPNGEKYSKVGIDKGA